ncbi:hypothetical protein [Micromonospora sediminicola]|uniref:hypothetical protein n=1 Tax=Micromonospora sediminicola TaxID=946078 RepID=UPI0037B4ED1C
MLALPDVICDRLHRYWEAAIKPTGIRLVLEADTTYRARQLPVGGARLPFADMHPNLHSQRVDDLIRCGLADGPFRTDRLVSAVHTPCTAQPTAWPRPP